eukprot:TRINITY_DN3502_c0_g2_i4.p1 TRINITY_DN3502_c0_g2~~TRINITY_DN3502_c0_g2_i4.p1  ORF type:complete len:147 (+),score=16.06 TRINITY_DN3502_c0_g2_i4:61-441(+)
MGGDALYLRTDRYNTRNCMGTFPAASRYGEDNECSDNVCTSPSELTYSVRSSCVSAIPNQPANTLRIYEYETTSCNQTNDGTLQFVGDYVSGVGGCYDSSYYACDGLSYTYYECTDSMCRSCSLRS